MHKPPPQLRVLPCLQLEEISKPATYKLKKGFTALCAKLVEDDLEVEQDKVSVKNAELPSQAIILSLLR